MRDLGKVRNISTLSKILSLLRIQRKRQWNILIWKYHLQNWMRSRLGRKLSLSIQERSTALHRLHTVLVGGWVIAPNHTASHIAPGHIAPSHITSHIAPGHIAPSVLVAGNGFRKLLTRGYIYYPGIMQNYLIFVMVMMMMNDWLLGGESPLVHHGDWSMAAAMKMIAV